MKRPWKPRFIRRTFLAGLLLLLPLFVTYILVTFLFTLFSSFGAPLARTIIRFLPPGHYDWAKPLVPTLNLVFSLSVIFLLGLFGANFLGRRVIRAFEHLLLRLPIVNRIYGGAKQVVDTFGGSRGNFERVVMVQYPSKGLWVMGFVTAEHPDGLHLSASPTLLAVFIPTTPNPTSGYLVLVSREDVVAVDYSVEEAFKFIVSSGILGKPLAAPPPAGAENAATDDRPTQASVQSEEEEGEE